MPRLIVDDAGKQKAFRVTKGRLSVGSSAESKLALTASGVEDHHANVLVTPEGVRVQVLAPVTIAGERVLGGEVELEFGQSLLIGAATIVVKSDDEAAPAAKPAAGRSGAAGAGARRSSGGTTTRRGAAGATTAGGTRRRAGDRGAQKKQGVPPIAIIGGVVVLIAVVVFFFKGMPNAGNELNKLVAAEEMLDEGKLTRARTLLGDVDTSILESADQQRHKDLLVELKEREEFATEATVISAATKMVDEDLKGLVAKQFKTEPVRTAKVRLLLDYIDRFRSTYPKHASELWRGDSSYNENYQWILDAEAKYGEQASSSDPYTDDDIAFREEYFLTKSPKRFNEVMPVVEAAIAAADDSERGEYEAIRERLAEAQRVYADERMAKSRDQYQAGQASQAAGTLITDILHMTDPQLVDRAAGVLIGFEEANAIFLGMQKNQPARFEALQKNDRIKRFVEANIATQESDSGE
ncbi:MAG: FHA domain-containing protein [Planctomycetota bacterium]